MPAMPNKSTYQMNDESHSMNSSEEDIEPEQNRCSCTICEYGPGNKDGTYTDPHYLCTEHTEWWMCDLCKLDGFGRCHRQHMTLRTDKLCEPLNTFIYAQGLTDEASVAELE